MLSPEDDPTVYWATALFVVVVVLAFLAYFKFWGK